ncbi:MAG: M48 family metalloprotease [Flavisolibacter sp.]
MRNTNILVLALLLPILASSQDGNPASLTRDPDKEKALLDGMTNRFKKDQSDINGENKKYIAQIYKERFESIKEHVTENEIITDPAIVLYLSKLTGQIFQANPQLQPADLRIVFSKAWWPNASSMGEGTILFNIGLFNRLQNESQAVFVLCHELAHFYLDHGNKAIMRYVNAVYSDEFQKQLKSIQKSDYRQNQQLESLAQGLSFKSRRHSREFEQAADSMAIEFMKSTSFDLNESLRCLGLLDSVDKDKYPSNIELSHKFDFASFHFKKSWLESDALQFGAVKESAKELAEADSLKTHPDCKTRINMLRGAVKKYEKPGTKKFLVDESTFRLLQGRFDYEILNYCFESGRISRCLFYTLEMLNAYPDDMYLHAMVGKCLNEMYAKQKIHELGKIVDLPSPEFDEEYNKLLRLIQNTRLSEIAALSYYFLQQYETKDESSKLFSVEWTKSKENFNN